jgi:hypothetical protein
MVAAILIIIYFAALLSAIFLKDYLKIDETILITLFFLIATPFAILIWWLFS